MMKCKYIDDYISDIEAGGIPASKEMMQAAAYIRGKLDNPDVFIDNEKIEKAKELIERYLEMTLIDWELFVLSLIHCYYKKSDTVVFDEFLIVMGRGNGKNGFISGISWYLTTHYHGIKGYNVDIVANSEDQAQTSFNDIYEMLGRTWNKSKKFFYKSKTLITNLKTNSAIKYNTSNAKTKDGKRSACLIFDELHEYENSSIIGVFTSGFGKRKHSRIFKITTNGYVREGVLDDELRLAADVLNGDITDLGLCPLIYKLDSEEEVHNPQMWVKANPSLPYFPELKKQMEKDYIKMKYDVTTEMDFFTKRMNLPKVKKEVDVTDYANIKATHILNEEVRDIPNLSGRPCVIGIDYASINDFASVNARFRVGEYKIDINHSWLCLRSTNLRRIKAPWQKWVELELITAVDDIEISPDLITEWIYNFGKNHNIVKAAIDNFRYALMKKSLDSIGFEPKERKNLKMIRPSDIMTIEPVMQSDFNNHRLIWGDNPVLRWATNNTKRIRSGKAKDRREEETDTGNYYYGKKEEKSRKTDPYMAVVASAIIEDELNCTKQVMIDVPVFTF